MCCRIPLVAFTEDRRDGGTQFLPDRAFLLCEPHLRIELGGSKVPPHELVAKINAMLAEVAKELKLE